MKAKFVLLAVAVILIIAVAVGIFFWSSKPQVITIGGTKLTLLGVTYGKHHVAPKSKIAGTRRNGARMDTTNDTLVVWILSEHKANQYGGEQLLVSDEAGTGCVSAWANMNSEVKPGTQLEGFTLNAYPRWDKKIVLRAQTWNGNQRLSKDKFVINNPKRETAPKWTAEAMPDTQTDGDFSATLTKFVYGVHGFSDFSGAASDPASKAVNVEFHLEQNGVAATNWEPIHLTTSDASGNESSLNSWSNPENKNGNAGMTYQWGLWSSQTPWKLRVEFSQKSSFSDDELWTVTNVTVKSGTWQDMSGYGYNGRNSRTNSAIAETTIGDFHLKMFPVFQFTDQNRGNNEKPGGFRVSSDKSTDGYQMTLVSATDENGRKIPYYDGSGWGGNDRQFQLQNLRNAKSVNITLALHKSRFVEFIAKPEISSK